MGAIGRKLGKEGVEAAAGAGAKAAAGAAAQGATQGVTKVATEGAKQMSGKQFAMQMAQQQQNASTASRPKANKSSVPEMAEKAKGGRTMQSSCMFWMTFDFKGTPQHQLH